MKTSNLVCLLCVGLFFVIVQGSHFRFGTIEWFAKDPNQPNVITFRINTAWRDSFFYASLGGYFTPGSICYRNGSSCYDMTSQKNNFFAQDDWMTGQFGPDLNIPGQINYVHTYPAYDADWLVDHTSCCRIGALQNNANAYWRITGVVTIRMDKSVLKSPISNTLPIVPIPYNQPAAQYTLSVTPAKAGGTVTFRMATSDEMGGSQVHPNSLVIANAKTGLMQMDTRNKVLNGLYHTQQIIIDDATGGFIPIDYLIKVTVVTTFCNPGCTNKLTACSTFANCYGCTGIPQNQQCTTSQPVLLQSPTHTALVSPSSVANALTKETGEVYAVAPDTEIRIEIIAHDAIVADPNKVVTVYTGSLPPGATLSSQSTCSGSSCSCPTCNNPQRRTFSWTPSANNLGDFALCIGVRSADGTELSYAQHCVTITVARPACGTGQLIAGDPGTCAITFEAPCACQCPNGFSAASRCLQCTSQFYGQSCKPCPACQNGACADGSLGNGQCICNPGWEGALCEKEKKDSCKPNAATTILSQIDSASAPVSPTQARVLITQQLAQNFNFPIKVRVGTPLLDVILLQDLSAGMSSQDISNLQSYISSFFTTLGTVGKNPYIGVGSFNHLANGYARISALSSDAATLKTKINSLSTQLTTGSNPYAIQAVAAAASDAGYGWRADSFKVIVVLSAKQFSNGDVADLNNKLLAGNVVPVFLNKQATNPFAATVTTLGYGDASAGALQDPQTNWATRAQAGVAAVLKHIVLKTRNDPSGYVTPPAPITNAQGETTINAVLKNPGGAAPAQLPVISLVVVGWGTCTLNINVNRAPVAYVTSIVTNEDTVKSFVINADDVDRNKLDVIFTALPAKGTFKTSANANIVVNTPYPVDALLPMTYNPLQDDFGTYSFTYKVNDGCVDSPVATGSVVVNSVNDAPTADDFSITINQDATTVLDFALATSPQKTPNKVPIADADDLTASLQVFIAKRPSQFVTLKDGSTTLTADNVVATGRKITIVPNPKQYGTASFQYYVRDVQGQTSATKTVTINIVDVKDAPILKASTSFLQVSRGSSGTIKLTVEDYDANDGFVMQITFSNGTTLGAPPPDLFIASVLALDGKAIPRVAFPTASNPVNHTQNLTPTKVNPFLAQWEVSLGYTPLLDEAAQCQDIAYNFLCPFRKIQIKVRIVDTSNLVSNELTLYLEPSAATYDPPYDIQPTTLAVSTNEDTAVTFDVIIVSSGANQYVTALLTVAPPTIKTEASLYPTNDAGVLSYNIGAGDVPITAQTLLPLAARSQGTNSALAKYTLKYTPGKDFNGQLNLPIVVGRSSGAASTISLVSRAITGTITVTAVNDLPTSKDITVRTLEDTLLTIDQIPFSDVDTQTSQLKLIITSTVGKGTLTRQGGAAITIGAAITGVTNWVLEYTPPAHEHSDPNQVFTSFKFRVEDAVTNAVEYTCSIEVQNTDDAPYSTNVDVDTQEDTSVEITFDAFDYDVPDLPFILAQLSIPLTFKGQLFLDAALTIPATSGSNTTYDRKVWYLPPADEFSYNPLKGESKEDFDPLDEFSYILIQDIPGRGLTSVPYSVKITVGQVNDPPKFDRLPLHRVIREDTEEDFILYPISQTSDDDTPINQLKIFITEIPTKGFLKDIKLSAPDESTILGKNTALPYRVTSEAGQISFTPNANEYGNDYANFTFILQDLYGANSTFTYTIDVTSVNDPPVLHPMFDIPVVMAEDSEITLAFNASDVDDPISSITAAITSEPTNGKLYACVVNGNGCTRGIELVRAEGESKINLTKVSDGLWKVVFVPEENQFASSYSFFAFSAYDTIGLRSDPLLVRVKVTPVNDPPVIVIPPEENVATFISDPAIIKGLKITDPDAVNKPIYVKLKMVGSFHGNMTITDDKAFKPRKDPFDVNNQLPAHCTIDNAWTEINCTASQQIINNYMDNLVYYPSGASTNPVTINIYASDLGNTGPAEGPEGTATANMTITIRSLPEIVGGAQNLTFTAIGAVIGGLCCALIAALIIRKKLQKPEEDYFAAFDVSANDSVVESPLYQESGTTGVNPLHRLSKMGADEIYQLDHAGGSNKGL